MALESVLIGLGGQLLGKLVAKKFGPEMGEIAADVLGQLGEAFGVEPTEAAIEAAITAAPKAQAEATVTAIEGRTVELVLAETEKMKAGNEQQRLTNELLMAQIKVPGWRGDWLYAWQWFLMLCWAWTIFVVHILNATIRIASGAAADTAVSLPAPDVGILVTLTGLYLGLHMGGHTVLELVRHKWGGLFGGAKDETGAAD